MITIRRTHRAGRGRRGHPQACLSRPGPGSSAAHEGGQVTGNPEGALPADDVRHPFADLRDRVRPGPGDLILVERGPAGHVIRGHVCVPDHHRRGADHRAGLRRLLRHQVRPRGPHPDPEPGGRLRRHLPHRRAGSIPDRPVQPGRGLRLGAPDRVRGHRRTDPGLPAQRRRHPARRPSQGRRGHLDRARCSRTATAAGPGRRRHRQHPRPPGIAAHRTEPLGAPRPRHRT
jgi:hypothetical protein